MSKSNCASCETNLCSNAPNYIDSGRPGLPVPNKPTVSVDVKQHFNHSESHATCVQ